MRQLAAKFPDAEIIPTPPLPGLKMMLVDYPSPDNFSTSIDESKLPTKKEINGKDHYLYKIFIFEVKVEDEVFIVLAAPLSSLLKQIFKKIVITSYSHFKLSYFSLKLDSLPDLYSEAVPLNATLRTSSVGLEYQGDSNDKIDSITISGKNVMASPGFSKIRQVLAGRHKIVRARFENDKAGRTVSFATDRFGNMSFKVDSEGRGIISIRDLLKFFYDEQMSTLTPVLPSLRRIPPPLQNDQLENDTAIPSN
jgi:hypothetical protein